MQFPTIRTYAAGYFPCIREFGMIRLMKYLVRCFLFNSFALWLCAQVIPGIEIRGGWEGMLFSALVLSILMLIVKPLLKILFIPVNIMTFGLLSWTINIIVVYLLTFLVPGVVIHPWNFSGISFSGIIIPAFPVSYMLSLTCVTISLTVLSNVFHTVSER